MIRFHKLLFVAPIALATLVGCNPSQETSTETSQPNPAATEVSAPETTTTESTASVEGLGTAVTQTMAAVEAGDFETAKKEFKTFGETWGNIEGEIKAKSAEGYESIEKTADEISAALKESTPNTDELMTKLESLKKEIATIPQ